MKLELTKPSSLRAILMMGVFIFVFLGTEYYYVNIMARIVDEHNTVLAQNYALGISALGFLSWPFAARLCKRRGKQIGVAVLAAAAVLCLFFMEKSGAYGMTLFLGMAVLFILGCLGSETYAVCMKTLETRNSLARQVGISYAFGILLQFINNNLVNKEWVEAVVLSVFLLVLVICLTKSEQTAGETEDGKIQEKTEENGDGKIPKERIAGILLIVLVALMTCIFSTLDNIVTLQHAAGKADIGQWPRMLLACSGLVSGFLFDYKKRAFMNTIMYSVMMLSTLCVAILQLGGSFLIGLIVFYLSSGFFVVFFTASFMEISEYMKMPPLWAGMGRAVNNLSAAVIAGASLALMGSQNNMTEIVVALVLFVAAYMAVKKEMEERELQAGDDASQKSAFEQFSQAYGFTQREIEVLDLLVNTEKNIQEIAETLYISRRTCQRHITAIYEKAGVKSRMGLYQVYMEKKMP